VRIVDVCAFYSPTGGGVRTYIDAKLRSAERLGHEIIVVIPSATAEVQEISPRARLAGIPSPTMPFERRYRYFDDAARLHQELDRWRPDHVECSSPWSSASAVARWQGTATRALFMHSDPMAAYAYRWFAFLKPAVVDRLFSRFWNHIRFLGRNFDTIISPNSQLAERLRQRGLTNIATIPLGVGEGFSPQLRDASLRSRMLGSLGLGPSATLLVSVGRLAPEKRPDLVARAVADLARSRDVGLVFAGDGPMRRKLQRIAAASGRIGLLGQVSDRKLLAQLVASADAFVHGCEAETFGLAVAEALASGTPVIVPDRGGASEQAEAGFGLTYASASKADLTRTLSMFLDSRKPGMAGIASSAATARLMDDHFRDLFACYEKLRCPTALSNSRFMNAM
jgi:alpha-1,6-mannosyltransferase